jgi:hypothetical protein
LEKKSPVRIFQSRKALAAAETYLEVLLLNADGFIPQDLVSENSFLVIVLVGTIAVLDLPLSFAVDSVFLQTAWANKMKKAGRRA